MSAAVVPGKRLRNWHRANNSLSGTRMSLRAYARALAAQGGTMGAVAKQWLASK